MSSNQFKLTVLIPVYKSDEIIPNLVKVLFEELNSHFSKNSFQILLVLDYPNEKSWKIIRDLSKKYKQLTCLKLNKNYGQHNAIFCGLRYVNSDYVVLMDDDFQHHPKYIFPMYRKINDGYDVVYTRFKSKKHSLIKNFGSIFNSYLMSKLVNKPKNFYASPYKIISNNVYKKILEFNYTTYYLDSLIFSISNNITSIEIDHFERYSGVGNYNFNRSLKLFFSMLFNSSTKPLSLISYFAFIFGFVSIFIAFFLIYQKLFYDLMPDGWTSIMCLLLFLFSILSFAIAIVGNYIGKIFELITLPKNKFKVDEHIKDD